MLPTGQTFTVADGTLSFAEFGELVSQVWVKAVPNVPMYPAGTPSDEVNLPSVTWSCSGRVRSRGAKDRIIDEFIGDDGKAYTKRIGEYRCVFEVRVSAAQPSEANQLVETFERFMSQYVGAFKKAGARELLYLERKPDEYERLGAQHVSHRIVQYEFHEQFSFIDNGPLIEEIAIIASAIRST
jgi:hypothetical protein